MAFRAFSFARKLVAIFLFALVIAFLGFVSGLFVTIRSGGLFYGNARINILSCLKAGFFTGRGILITLLLLVIIFAIMLIYFSSSKFQAYKSRVRTESIDPDTGVKFANKDTAGSEKFLSNEEAREKFQCGNILDLVGFLMGKLTDDSGDVLTFEGGRIGDPNKNWLLLGDSGSGKSRKIIRNEIFQALRRNESIVVTDPKEELYTDFALYCQDRCDGVYAINFKNPEFSSAWNCLSVVIDRKTGRLDTDRMKIWIETYLTNATGNIHEVGTFWYGGAVSIMSAIIGLYAYEREDYIRVSLMQAIQAVYDAQGLNEEVPARIRYDKMYSLVKAERLFRKVAEGLLTDKEIEDTIQDIKKSAPPFTISQVYAEVMTLQDGDYETFKKRLSVLPHRHPAWSSYKAFATEDAKGEARGGMLQGLAQRMSPLANEMTRKMLSNDELNIFEINEKKLAVFLLLPTADFTLTPILALFFKFLFMDLADRWNAMEARCKERGLSVRNYLHPVSVLLDEFYAIGTIPGFHEFISVSRQSEINIGIAVQDLGQINQRYGEEAAKTIRNNCATVIFLGTNDDLTADWVSTFICGIATTIVDSYSQSAGTSRFSISATESVTETQRSRYLMYSTELRRFTNKVLVAQKGKYPIKLDPFDFEEHPNSKWLRKCYVTSVMQPIKNRFKELDPLVLMDLKEIERLAWEDEQMKALADGREAIFTPLVDDTSDHLLENRYRILHRITDIIRERLGAFYEDDIINLDELKTDEEVIDLDELMAGETKEPIIDGTYKEVDSPKPPKKKKRKKTAAPKPPVRPSDSSEFNE